MRSDYDDEHTVVNARQSQRQAPRQAPPATPVPRKLPAFVPAETVVPVVTYREQNQNLGRALESLEQSVMERMPRRPESTPVPAAMPRLQPRGALTVVFGCRGGSGATTLAINTAAQL